MLARWDASTVVFFSVVQFVGVGVTARCSLESVGSRQARSAADNFFESPVLSDIDQEAIYIADVSLPIRVFSAKGKRISRSPSGVRQQVRQQQLLYSLSAVAAQQDAGTRLRRASRATSHWYSSVGVINHVLLLHFGGIFFSRIFRGFFATSRVSLKYRDAHV